MFKRKRPAAPLHKNSKVSADLGDRMPFKFTVVLAQEELIGIGPELD